jgi:hypothetical protein
MKNNLAIIIFIHYNMNCDNELIVCIDKTSNNPPKTNKTNKIYENMLKNIKEKIKNNKSITKEDIDFIESLSSEKKMEIILEYNKRTIENERIQEVMRTSALR